MEKMVRRLATAVMAFIALALLFERSTPAIGQGARGPTNLVLMLRTSSDLRIGHIRELMEYCLKKLSTNQGPVIVGEPEVKEISAAEYQIFNRLINNQTINADLPLPLTNDTIKVSDNESLSLRQLLAASPTWEIQYSGPKPVALKAIELIPNNGKTLTFKEGVGKDISKLRSGGYSVKLPTEAIQKYRIEFEDIDGNPRIAAGNWPKGGNYFRVRLPGFSADREALVKVLKDGQTPNNLAEINFGEEITLAVGEAQPDEDFVGEEELRGNRLIVMVPKLRRGLAKRVWMKFPLTASKVNEALDEFKDLTGKEVSQRIYSAKDLIKLNSSIVITKGMPPTWIELPLITDAKNPEGLKANTFGRALPLASADSKKVEPRHFAELLKDLPTAHRLIVYEFDDEGTVTALKYKPNTLAESKFVHASALERWAALLTPAAGQALVPMPPLKKQ